MKKNDAILEKYVELLNLQDWHIVVNDNVEPDDLQDCFGDVMYQESKKLAIIRIVNPSKLSEQNKEFFSYRRTLLHELLHVKFALLDNSGNALQDRIVHQFVDDFAKIIDTLVGK